MDRNVTRTRAVIGGMLAWAAMMLSGCTGLHDYVHNGFKVGPNYCGAQAAVAPNWIDANDVRVRSQTDDLSHWWGVFQDPVLEGLICDAYRQNLSLRVAGLRVLEARAQMLIDTGSLFPQSQTATGGYTRNATSFETANGTAAAQSMSGPPPRFYDQWNYGFNLSWELDFWGRLRRAIEYDADNLSASVANYDDVLVTLLGDVATNYVTYRTTQQRIKYAQENVDLQRKTLRIVEGQQRVGIVGELDVDQARSTLEQTEAAIPELEIAQRQAANALCTLMGCPPVDLEARLGTADIPTAPEEVAVGIPADLLRRRPDVRRDERAAAAQSEQIGIAQAEFYPHVSITGSIGASAQNFNQLFQQAALTGNIGPSYTWNILNYGRIVNNVRLQDAKFRELVTTYRNTVLSAEQDVENGLVTFLKAQRRAKSQAASVADAKKAVDIVLAQYEQGVTDLTRVTLLQQNLVPLEDTLAQAQGEIATGLISTYRALGGGWEIRCQQPLSGDGPSPPEAVSAPSPTKP